MEGSPLVYYLVLPSIQDALVSILTVGASQRIIKESFKDNDNSPEDGNGIKSRNVVHNTCNSDNVQCPTECYYNESAIIINL